MLVDVQVQGPERLRHLGLHLILLAWLLALMRPW